MPTAATQEANRSAVMAMVSARPRLMDIRQAGAVIPHLGEGTILHAGPPIPWERMVDVQRGAVIGAVLYEGWAKTEDEARNLLERGQVQLVPCHDRDAVGGLAGVTSPSMPVVVVENAAGPQRAYCRLWDPRLIFGRHDSETVAGLRWLEAVCAPILSESVQRAGGVDVVDIVAKALHMGDECHSRLLAGSSLFLRALLPSMMRSNRPSGDIASVVDYLATHDGAFLPVVMAAAKVIALAGHGIPHSTVVTALCSNGYEMGIRLSGTGSQWFTAPAPLVHGHLPAGVAPEDASPQIGDSAITEVVGLGGCAMAASPTSPANVGGTLESAITLTREALRLAVAQHPTWTIPVLGFAGVACGIDAERMVETGMTPPLAATIPHRQAGGGRLGMGIARPPLSAFAVALAMLHGADGV